MTEVRRLARDTQNKKKGFLMGIRERVVKSETTSSTPIFPIFADSHRHQFRDFDDHEACQKHERHLYTCNEMMLFIGT